MRDYGLGDSTPYVVGPPKVVEVVDGLTCPNCKCSTVYKIEVKVVNYPLLRAHEGVGTYMGCPACPFASPMMVVGKGD